MAAAAAARARSSSGVAVSSITESGLTVSENRPGLHGEPEGMNRSVDRVSRRNERGSPAASPGAGSR